MTQKTRLTCAQTAKLVRKELKENFPGQKFSVRSDTYSIRVSWTDGPTTKAVEAVALRFEGAGFDGMIDLKYYISHWQMPDDSIILAHSQGTVGSGGAVPAQRNEKPHPDAVEVHFGADHVFCSREFSLEPFTQAVTKVVEMYGFEMAEIKTYEDDSRPYLGQGLYQHLPGSHFNLQDLVHQELQDMDLFTPPAKAKPKATSPAPTTEPNPTGEIGYRVEHDRDWTWIYFDGKPDEATREAIKSNGARWSRKRSGWYFRREVTEAEISEMIGQPQSAQNDSSAQPEPETPAPQPRNNPEVAAKLRATADKMQKPIDRKLDPPIGNQRQTARRARIAAGMYDDGKALQAVQTKLYALADAHDNGTIPQALAGIRHRTQIEVLTYWDYWPADRWEGKPAATLTRAGITAANFTEAKQALEALITIPQEDPTEVKIKELERNLIGRRIPGFFPTPAPLVQRMVEEAVIEPGNTVLEPSAGKGNIAEAIREAHPDNPLEVIEPVWDLREILGLKGFNLVGHDFLEHSQTYDRIILNPPFENEQDVDHVRHAYERLNPGGRIVAIMNESTFFRNGKAVEFRQWLDEVGWNEELPEGSFKESGTGVRTRLVVIDKPDAKEEAPALAIEDWMGRTIHTTEPEPEEEPCRIEIQFTHDFIPGPHDIELDNVEVKSPMEIEAAIERKRNEKNGRQPKPEPTGPVQLSLF